MSEDDVRLVDGRLADIADRYPLEEEHASPWSDITSWTVPMEQSITYTSSYTPPDYTQMMRQQVHDYAVRAYQDSLIYGTGIIQLQNGGTIPIPQTGQAQDVQAQNLQVQSQGRRSGLSLWNDFMRGTWRSRE